MKINNWILLIVLALAFGCTTTSSYYFGANEKTPKDTLARIVLGSNVKVIQINGEKVNIGPGPATLNLAPGRVELTTTAGYIYVDGNLVKAAPTRGFYSTLDLASSKINLTLQPQETWFVGMEFSRSILEAPAQIHVIPSDVALPLNPSTPEARLFARKVSWSPLTVVNPTVTQKMFIAPMPPFFSTDFNKIIYAQGGNLKVFTTADPNTEATYKVSAHDLVSGTSKADGTWWLVDNEGSQFVVDSETGEVKRTQNGNRVLGKVTKVVITAKGAVIQTGPKELKHINLETLEVTPLWSEKVPIISWTVAQNTEDFVIQTKDALNFFDAQGNLLSTKVKTLTDSPYWDSRNSVLSPDGSHLAYRDKNGLWVLSTKELDSFPSDQWKFLGHSAADLIPFHGLSWASDGQGIVAYDLSLAGKDYTAFILEPGAPSDQLLALHGGQFGEGTKIAGGGAGIAALYESARLSDDGKKALFFFTNITHSFYAFALVDSTRVRVVPKK